MQEFVDIYIEKLLSNINELNKKLFLVESQFEYNIKAANENLVELESVKQTLEKERLEHKNITMQIEKMVHEHNNELHNLRSNNQLQINDKNSAMHVMTLQLEEVKRQLIEQQTKNLDTVKVGSKKKKE
jgi:hypothetical protein